MKPPKRPRAPGDKPPRQSGDPDNPGRDPAPQGDCYEDVIRQHRDRASGRYVPNPDR
jgi:hypothetical protein